MWLFHAYPARNNPLHFSVICLPRDHWAVARTAATTRATAAGSGVPSASVNSSTQIQAGHLGRDGVHLAQLLASMLPGNPCRVTFEPSFPGQRCGGERTAWHD